MIGLYSTNSVISFSNDRFVLNKLVMSFGKDRSVLNKPVISFSNDRFVLNKISHVIQ